MAAREGATGMKKFVSLALALLGTMTATAAFAVDCPVSAAGSKRSLRARLMKVAHIEEGPVLFAQAPPLQPMPDPAVSEAAAAVPDVGAQPVPLQGVAVP